MNPLLPLAALCLLLTHASLAANDDAASSAAVDREASLQSDSFSTKNRMRQASMLLQGKGTEPDVEAAIAVYRELAERDLPYAQYRLARIYLDGLYIERDPVQAFTWLLRSAELGYVDAQLDLSELYVSGSGTSKSLVDAYKWLEIAASLSARDLSERMQQLEQQMSFFELTRARYLSRRCMLRGYERC